MMNDGHLVHLWLSPGVTGPARRRSTYGKFANLKGHINVQQWTYAPHIYIYIIYIEGEREKERHM